jgi:diguanylate cyclase (GGDEF)-like protein
VDWSTFPDLVCVTLLIFAFASVSRNSHTHQSKTWLAGWVLIAVHFVASMYLRVPGVVSNVADWIALSSLSGAAVLFVWSAIPYRKRVSSRWMLGALLGGGSVYIGLITMASPPLWVLYGAAALLGLLPLTVTVLTIQRFQRPERWVVVALYCVLSVFAWVVQARGDGPFLTVSGLLFTAYLSCCITFWFAYRMKTTGSFITIVGFLAWALVFVAAPAIQHYLPQAHPRDEVWNLPKYVVAVGMILLVLEDQIAHNRHLALHDELTDLPNRRLFHDRLENALSRADRKGEEVALLQIDLDNFKQVNDTEGHHVGDELLKRVSSIFLTRIRISDTVARTGGDEFSVLLEGPMTQRQAEEVVGSLKDLLKERFDLEGHKVRIGASIGLAMYPQDGKDAEALRIAADLAMYAEKEASRKREPEARREGLQEGLPRPLRS